MVKRLAMVGVLGLAVVLALGGSAAAVDFQPGDITGTWFMSAFGAYDVRGESYSGFIVFDQGTVVSGSGTHGSSQATWTGGGMSVNVLGQVNGVLQGRSDRNIQLNIKQGRLDLTKEMVTFAGEDQLGVQLIVNMTKVQ